MPKKNTITFVRRNGKKKTRQGKAREQSMVQKLVKNITRKDIEGKDNGNRI